MDSGFEHLLHEGVISEVVARLKSGKEADVYAVRYGGRVVAAKVYKERAHRSFKNNSAYKEGRTVQNSRSQRAIDRKTTFGRAASEAAWKSAEADALYKLHAADVRVPTPVMFLDGVLLMELVLDVHGDAAPRLIDVNLTPGEANAAYRDMVGQLVRILSCDLIHGDLSPYNVLWGAAGPTIIDFPQIISASHNSSSEAFFLRDARNILGHFAQIDPSLNARRGDPWEIWRAYLRRELTPDFLPVGRVQPQAPQHRGGHAGGPAAAGGRGQGQGQARPPRHDRPLDRPHPGPRGGSPRHEASGGRGPQRRSGHMPEVIVRVNRSVPPAAMGAEGGAGANARPQAMGAPHPEPHAAAQGAPGAPGAPAAGRRRRRRRRH